MNASELGEEVTAAADALRARGADGPFDAAIVLGTGLGAVAEDVDDAAVVPYAELPGFPRSGVSGHAGRLVAGRLGPARVLVLQGRAHYYERGDARVMRTPVGALAALGVGRLILTNAAGSANPAIPPGSLALLTDHINWSGLNPLIGEEGDRRFVPLTEVYDAALRRRFRAAAAASGVPLHEGVYMWFSGPSFETPAEIRAARALGADLVGMSTVPEAILARRFGLRVAALSAVTNWAAGLHGGDPSHGETKDVALAAAASLRRLLRAELTKGEGDDR